MGDFFHGWRRKTGVVTLVMACVLTAGWVRSYRFRDTFNCRNGDTSIHLVGSNWGRLSWHGLQESKPCQITFHNSFHTDAADANATHAVFENGKVEWHWQLGGFEFGKVIVRTPNSTMTVTIWELPYLYIVILVILISLWLLFSKSRNSTQTKIAKSKDAELVESKDKSGPPSQTSRKFRCTMIPAAFSWGFGGISLVAIPFGVLTHLKKLPIPQDAETRQRMIVYSLMVMPLCLFVFGCLNILAGWRWMEGRWRLALLLNAIAYGALLLTEAMN